MRNIIKVLLQEGIKREDIVAIGKFILEGELIPKEKFQSKLAQKEVKEISNKGNEILAKCKVTPTGNVIGTAENIKKLNDITQDLVSSMQKYKNFNKEQG